MSEDEKPKTAKDRLLELLWDQDWHDTDELREVAGQRYGARIHELRQLGFEINKRSASGDGYEYHLESREPSKPKKKQVRVYLDPFDAQMLAVGASTPDAREAIRKALDSYYGD